MTGELATTLWALTIWTASIDTGTIHIEQKGLYSTEDNCKGAAGAQYGGVTPRLRFMMDNGRPRLNATWAVTCDREEK